MRTSDPPISTPVAGSNMIPWKPPNAPTASCTWCPRCTSAARTSLGNLALDLQAAVAVVDARRLAGFLHVHAEVD